MNLLQNYHFQFCRLFIRRADLDFDIIGIVFKMDSGKKLRAMPSVSDSLFPRPFIFCGSELIRLFFKNKNLQMLHNFSCISECA